jgi:hypothetical protein
MFQIFYGEVPMWKAQASNKWTNMAVSVYRRNHKHYINLYSAANCEEDKSNTQATNLYSAVSHFYGEHS